MQVRNSHFSYISVHIPNASNEETLQTDVIVHMLSFQEVHSMINIQIVQNRVQRTQNYGSSC